MTVETALNIEDLNPLLPDDTGTPVEGLLNEDPAHTRLIKDVLKRIFKGVGGNGFNRGLVATEDEINFATGLSSNLQVQLTALTKASIPIGGLIMYSGAFASIPSNYTLCTGAGGTPDLTTRFVFGTNTEGQLEITGGSNDAIVPSHTHTADHNHAQVASSTDGSHSHDVKFYSGGAQAPPDKLAYQVASSVRATSALLTSSGDHTHNVTIDTAFINTSTDGVNGAGLNEPPYLRLAYIQRVS